MQARVRRQCLVAAIAIPIAMSVDVGLNLLGGQEPDENLLDFYALVAHVLVIAWLVSDPALPNEYRPSFDHFYLTWTLFPLLALYHQFLCHRWKGLARVLGLFILIYAPYMSWIILYEAS